MRVVDPCFLVQGLWFRV